MKIRALLAVLAIAGAIAPACAQQHHERHHNDYKEWVNQAGQGCCNNQDCGELAEDNERTANGKLEVRIEGQWCPVLPRHYLKKGNAPNWSTAHLCVRRSYYEYDPQGSGGEPEPPCDRLLCYQPKPSF